MQIHDHAHQLAKAIKTSEEYINFKALQEQVEGNPHLKSMIDDFHERQLELQKQQLVNHQIDPEDEKRLHDLLAVISKDPMAAAYLEAEMRFAQIMADISKILSDL